MFNVTYKKVHIKFIRTDYRTDKIQFTKNQLCSHEQYDIEEHWHTWQIGHVSKQLG